MQRLIWVFKDENEIDKLPQFNSQPVQNRGEYLALCNIVWTNNYAYGTLVVVCRKKLGVLRV